MVGYYDAVLGLIPLALAGITALLTVVGFTVTTAIPLASVVSVALIGHAMFVSPPTDTSTTDASAGTPETVRLPDSS